jgi:hypothetical protein
MAEVGEGLSQLSTTALKLIGKENYFSALDYLQDCQDLLEDYSHPDMSLLVLNNKAVCFQKIGRLDECLRCVLACRQRTQETSSDDLVARIKAVKASCKHTAQACALMSQLSKHSEALALAKDLMEDAKLLVKELKALCNEQGRFLSSSVPHLGVLRSRGGKEETLSKALEIVSYLDDFLTQRRTLRPPEMSYRSVLGIQKFNDWIFNYTIGTIMTPQLITPLEIKNTASWDSELCKDALIHVTSILIVAHFCLATEMRFFYTEEGDLGKVRESELWHKQSIELATSLLPLECPLVEHLKVSYNRNYAVFLEEDLKMTRPRLKVLPLKLKPSSKTILVSPLRTERAKSKTVTPVKSSSVERSMQRTNRVNTGRTRNGASPYRRSGLGKKINLENKRLIRHKFEMPYPQ